MGTDEEKDDVRAKLLAREVEVFRDIVIEEGGRIMDHHYANGTTITGEEIEAAIRAGADEENKGGE